MEPPAPPPDGEATSLPVDGGNVPTGGAVVSLNDVERSRRESVLAYCARLCDPDRIVEAVDAAFADLHETLEEADGHAALDLDRILLEATRAAASERSDASAALPGFAGLALRRSSACEVMPKLLAARASALLGDADLDRVERHLARCAACRELERRRSEAERAYELLRADPPTGSAEPWASPGDQAPEITAAHPTAPADDVDAVPAAVAAPLEADAADDPDATAEHVAVAPVEPGDDEPVAGGDAEPDPAAEETREEPPAATGATGEYAFELSDPEPLDGPERDREPETEPAVVAAAPHAAEGAPPARRSAWFKWGPVVGPLAAAAIAIGVIAALSEDEDERPQRPAPQRAAAPSPAPAPAAPSPAQIRTERRLEALGDRELGPGTSGDDVKVLQRLLGVPPTGNYGELTQYAVGEFQATHDIPVDGRAGTETKRALARRPRPPENPPTLPADPAGQQAPEGEAPSDPNTQEPGTATPPPTEPGVTGPQAAPGTETP